MSLCSAIKSMSFLSNYITNYRNLQSICCNNFVKKSSSKMVFPTSSEFFVHGTTFYWTNKLYNLIFVFFISSLGGNWSLTINVECLRGNDMLLTSPFNQPTTYKTCTASRAGPNTIQITVIMELTRFCIS